MTVVAANLYRHGKLVGPVTLDQAEPCAKERSEFVWIELFEPTEAELRQLQDNYGLHPLAVEDALTAHQLPKVDVYGDQIFVVARTAYFADDQITYGETSIFVSETFVISVRHGSARAHSDLRHQLEASPALLRHGVDYVLHAILDFIVDGYLPIVEAIEEDVLETEQRALEAFLDRSEIRRLFTLRREIDPVPARSGTDARGLQQAHAPRAPGPRPGRAALLSRRARPCAARRDASRRLAGNSHLRIRGGQSARAATAGHNHPPARRLGGDPCRPDGDRRHLRDELRQHARAQDGIRLFYRARGDHCPVPRALFPVQEGKVALNRHAGWEAGIVTRVTATGRLRA